MIEIDDFDRALLRALQRDANQSAGALGREIGMSQPGHLAPYSTVAGGRRDKRAEVAFGCRGTGIRGDSVPWR